MVNGNPDKQEFALLNSAVKEVVESLKSDKSDIGVLEELKIDNYGTPTVELSGGLNGCGSWDDYFRDLAKIIETLRKKKQIKMWLIEGENDCVDDVFYFHFGVRKMEESERDTDWEDDYDDVVKDTEDEEE